jgi:hypothetical protein
MGLFSSKVYYNAYAGSQSLFEEQPDTVESNILQTAIGNEGTMSGAIRFAIATDQFARAKAMMRYAGRFMDPARNGGYVRGFPEANLNLVKVSSQQIEAALTRDIGDWESILYLKVGTYDEIFMVEKVFQDMYPNDFDFSEGTPEESLWHPGLSEFDIPVVNPDTGEYYKAENDISILRIEPDWDWGDDFEDGYQPPIPEYLGNYSVSFPYTDNNGDDQIWTTPVSIQPYLSGDWIQIRYALNEVQYHWVYEVGSGLDPILESHIQRESLKAEFLPVAVLMHDKVWFNEDPDSELAITTNKLLKKMGTSGDTVREDFEEAEEENPEESGDKWDFFMHFAVPIDTRVRGSMEYLWFFFKELDNWESFDTQDYYDYLATLSGNSYTSAQPINEINITEAGISGYNVDYRWSYIHTTSHVGEWEVTNTDEAKYGPGALRALRRGEVAKELYQLEQGIGTNPEYTEVVERAFGTGTDIGIYSEDPELGGYHDMVVLWRQRKDDELEPGDDPEVGRYDQMIVMGLSMQYRINTSEEGDLRFRYAVPLLFGDEEETKEFRIPILYGSILDVPVIHREEAIADGFTGTVFLVERIKVKWYQRSFFKWLIVIVAIVLVALAIFYPPFYAVLEAYAGAIAAAFTTSAFAAVVIYNLLLFAIGSIIAMASATIGQEFGSTAGQLFAVIAAIAMFRANGGFDNISKTWSEAVRNPGWATAFQFMQAAYPIYDMGFQVYRAHVLSGYEDELRDFLADARERQQQLKDAWDSFGPTPDWIDPMDLVNMFKRIGSAELANSYLSRTLTLNPGILGYEAIGKFPEIALMLPKDLQEGTVIDAMMQDFADQRGAV